MNWAKRQQNKWNWLQNKSEIKIEERLPKVIEVPNKPLHQVSQKIDCELIIFSENILEFGLGARSLPSAVNHTTPSHKLSKLFYVITNIKHKWINNIPIVIVIIILIFLWCINHIMLYFFNKITFKLEKKHI